MDHSTTLLSHAAHSRLAPGHDDTGKPAPNWHMAVLVGAGGIISSADDMLLYLKANMGLLKTDLYPAMQLAQSPSPYVPRRPIGELGLAWMIEHANGGDLIEHNGMTGGYASYVGFTADRKHGVVVLTNKALAVDNLGQAALSPGIVLVSMRKHLSMSAKELDEYVGRYELLPGFVLTVSRSDAQLKAQATGQGAFPVYPNAKDEFFTNATDVSLSFKRDAQGKIDGVVVHQGGDHPGRRLAPGEGDGGGKPDPSAAKTEGSIH
ncbi:serine hydrolase [Dyella sp. LX-66]|uniref:serine hydrolase n=1 Tax=unclassified Dyella TaxID=2634549 RepID=UPI001BDFBF91|nr:MULTISPECIES: serine hydrolase [unclassified Dyella]MBT2118490.1 serine hydrolase [Dyella sp. LX-1]MBT2142380.1 serine hydrolase [Dyella sp. LX-66]